MKKQVLVNVGWSLMADQRSVKKLQIFSRSSQSIQNSTPTVSEVCSASAQVYNKIILKM